MPDRDPLSWDERYPRIDVAASNVPDARSIKEA
jgi:hypothetical protein